MAGATGLTGREVVRALRARGVDTVAHVRPDSSRLAHWRAELEGLGAVVDTTPWEEAEMTRTFSALEPTMVFALLGTTRARARKVKAAAAAEEAAEAARAESYEAVDYGLTALLRRAAEASGAPRFVYLSSMGVSDSTSNAYLRVRARLEAELRDGDLPYTIVRPSFIVGDRDEKRFGEAVGAAIADSALGLLGAVGARKTRDRYRSITGRQLADALVRLALDPGAEGRVVSADELR